MKKKKAELLILLFLLAFLILYTCGSNDVSTTNRLSKQDVYGIMQKYYLWNETMPKININQYQSPKDVLEALRNQTYDYFSHITKTSEYTQYFDKGEYIGYGFSHKWDDDDNLRIAFVFQDSPMYEAGIRRGWKIIKINGKEIPAGSPITPDIIGEDEIGVTNIFTLEDDDGNVADYSFSKQIIKINTVLYHSIIEKNDKKIGYLVFCSFIEPSEDELEAVFNDFSEECIDELIIDLRYNSGGRGHIAQYLAGLIGGQASDGEEFISLIHNAKNTSLNKVHKFHSYPNSVDINRLFFITTGYTASASEALINGLRPMMDVFLIGDDTRGKPVGMYAFLFDDYTFSPVCYKIVNSDGEGDYYDGLLADAYVMDDLGEAFGSIEEDCLKEALYYIENGRFSSTSTKKSYLRERIIPFEEGFRFEKGVI